jgi:probable HAF family extracellular repeat protein
MPNTFNASVIASGAFPLGTGVNNINDSSEIVGVGDSMIPFVFSTRPQVTILNRLPPLPVAAPHPEGEAICINNSGDIVGYSQTLDSNGRVVKRATLWNMLQNRIEDLGTLYPAANNPGIFIGNSTAHAINDNGIVVGESDTTGGQTHGFILDTRNPNSAMVDIGSLLPPTMSGAVYESWAYDINNNGDVVGQATAVDSGGNTVLRAFLLKFGSATMLDLGTHIPDPNQAGFFKGQSRAFAINDSGTIVGMSDIQSGPSVPTIFASQSSNALVAISQQDGAALDVNSSDIVVGYHGDPELGFVFDLASALIDLTSTVTMPAQIASIERGVSINAQSQIIANADNGISLLIT